MISEDSDPSREELSEHKETSSSSATKDMETVTSTSVTTDPPQFKLPAPISSTSGPSVTSSESASASQGFEPVNVIVATEPCTVSSTQNDPPQSAASKSSVISKVYKKPIWSGTPPSNYCFEVIKQGTMLTKIQCDKEYLLVGRLQDCDIQLEHPSVSRYHAVIQYCKGTKEVPAGFYVYDLGSTHGTFRNKKAVKEKSYWPLKVGYVVKFGFSTRLFVLQGPEPEETDGTNVEESEGITEESGCDWGMGEDAQEDDLAVNPFALSTPNEELYLSDPKKTLRNWFEQEGYNLEYKVEEKATKHFTCSVDLPIEDSSGGYITVDATINGKKKEAVVACALEACRMLDRHGVLRPSQHDSHQPKRKKWEDDDFYDSDEDPFLDRTGALEKKREWRKKLVKNKPVENYESIVKKLEMIDAEIDEIKDKLGSSRERSTLMVVDNWEIDPLDSYMSEISDPRKVPLDPVTKTKLRHDLAELEKKKEMYEKMKAISASSFPKEHEKTTDVPVPKPVVEKVCEEAGAATSTEQQLPKEAQAVPVLAKEETTKSCNKANKRRRTVIMKTAGNKVNEKPIPTFTISEDSSDEEEADSSGTSEGAKRPLPDTPEKDEKEKLPQDAEKINVIKCASSTDYSMWVPPADQSGDGTTHLNAKYGY